MLNVEIVTCVNQSAELLGLRLVGFNQFKCIEIGYITEKESCLLTYLYFRCLF